MKERIKKLRKELNLTQQEFADRIGISRNNIATYETGKSNPSDAVINLLRGAFHVREAWLRKGEGEMFAPQDEATLLDDATLDDMDKAILKAYIAAPKELRAYLKEKIIELAQAAATQPANPAPASAPAPVVTAPKKPSGISDEEWEVIQHLRLEKNTETSTASYSTRRA